MAVAAPLNLAESLAREVIAYIYQTEGHFAEGVLFDFAECLDATTDDYERLRCCLRWWKLYRMNNEEIEHEHASAGD